ncbi:MAG: acyltransferase [Candidatus Margulisbacteria bacterium GWF2_35_9]|nr:MAG: acyltransferase [Candidatus Margulisbacteria bacterium GWF2_35_9]
MLFNSIDFAIFLPIVFVLYWFVFQRNLKLQNFFLLIVSYVFYGWWDWRFLSLIIFSSFVDYSVGIGLSKTDDRQKRKLLLLTSIFINLGFLGFFKYYNFFLENFVNAFSFFGHPISQQGLSIILPVGISFYTFQTLSYSIDVYKRKLEPTKDIIAFFSFVSFFPQLVAGPIERASNLLPQFYKKRTFKYDKAVDGMRQILWGLFKKIVIADNCAIYVNAVFGNTSEYTSSTLVLAVILFALQIYGDFSGYSDIAIGVSKLFDFKLMKNFAFPYFSRDIAEFWRRWHISLSTGFRDYVYIPLGGSRVSTLKKVRNIFIVFIVSGFWHGANWTFIVWGAINALAFLPLLLFGKNRTHIDAMGKIPKLKELFLMAGTFTMTCFAWIFFRSESILSAFIYIKSIFSWSLFTMPMSVTGISRKLIILLSILFVIVEWFQKDKEFGLDFRGSLFKIPINRWIVYVLMLFIIYYAGKFNHSAFIYFQF